MERNSKGLRHGPMKLEEGEKTTRRDALQVEVDAMSGGMELSQSMQAHQQGAAGVEDAFHASEAEAAVQEPVDMQDAIGRQLRELYGQTVAEPLPDRLMGLLDQLKASKGQNT